VKSIVLLACGHWFRERRGNHTPHPVDGEERRCPQLGCHGRIYRAVYIADFDLSVLGIAVAPLHSYCSDDV
jgi:hypothetical protein